MFIGVIVLTAAVCTALITYFFHLNSQNNFFDFQQVPYKSPIGLSLTFICNLLFVASTLMVLQPFLQLNLTTSSINAFAQQPLQAFSPSTVSYYPENAVAQTQVGPTPLSTFQPYQQQLTQAESETATTLAQESIDTPDVSPTATPKPTTAPTATKSDSLENIDTGSIPVETNNLADSNDVYVITINNQTKGYTAAFLNALTIYKDLLADERVMITVDETGANFYNLDTENSVEATQVTPNEWQQTYPDAPLADVSE